MGIVYNFISNPDLVDLQLRTCINQTHTITFAETLSNRIGIISSETDTQIQSFNSISISKQFHISSIQDIFKR